MGKKNVAAVVTESAPVLTVVQTEKPKRESRYATVTVKIALANVEATRLAIGEAIAKLGVPTSEKILKSGALRLTVGKVSSAGRPKLTEAQKAERKAEREKINATAKSLRKQMRSNPIMAAFASKLANGQKLSEDERAELIKLVS